MTGNEYKYLAMRTNDGKATERLSFWMGANDTTIDVGGVLNGCLGLAGESGELLDMVKKWIFHNTRLDRDHAKKEVGDVLWYVAMICHSMGWDLDEIMQMNVDKLKARYPMGFDTEKSNHRAKGDI